MLSLEACGGLLTKISFIIAYHDQFYICMLMVLQFNCFGLQLIKQNKYTSSLSENQGRQINI